MFEETQKCSNTSSWSDPAIEATPQTGSFASTQMPDEPETKFELPSISNLKVGIFTKGLQHLLEDQRPTKNTVEGCYASEENFSVLATRCIYIQSFNLFCMTSFHGQ